MVYDFERKMVIVDLLAGFRRPNVKACPTCGAGASAVNVAPTTDEDFIARAVGELRKLEVDGWELDLTHADTKRFHNTVEGLLPLDDLVFAVAATRAKR